MHVFGVCLNLSFNSINHSSRTSCGGVEPSGNAASLVIIIINVILTSKELVVELTITLIPFSSSFSLLYVGSQTLTTTSAPNFLSSF
jgi:hypothetical protein